MCLCWLLARLRSCCWVALSPILNLPKHLRIGKRTNEVSVTGPKFQLFFQDLLLLTNCPLFFAESHSGLKIFTGNSNKALAHDIVSQLGISLGKITVNQFADGEVNVMVNENVRGKDVYIIQPTSPPVNETLMELLLMISTMRRASARKITAVIPYYGYARQDRKLQARVPISAADVARLLEAMGVDRVVAVDLHCGQIQGFFGPRVPVDNLDGGIVGVSHFGDMDLVNPVIVSPDAGGVHRAKKFRDALQKKYDMDPSLAMIVKQRGKPGEIERMDLVGSVMDCDVIIGALRWPASCRGCRACG